MVNNRGFIKIVEATISVLIVIGVILVISSGSRQYLDVSNTDNLQLILDEISENSTLRDLIFAEQLTESKPKSLVELNEELKNNVSSLINRRLSPEIKFEFIVCKDLEKLCSLEKYPLDAEGVILSKERIISTTINQEGFDIKEARKIKIYVWRST